MSFFGLFKKKEEKPKPSHSFCETVSASSESPWHIRKLTEKGKKLGGGADTESLCGFRVSWDLNVEITEHHLNHCCKLCASEYRREVHK